MDALNQFMHKYKIPHHLRTRANDFCFYAHNSKYSMSDSMRDKAGCVSVADCVRACVRAYVRASAVAAPSAAVAVVDLILQVKHS